MHPLVPKDSFDLKNPFYAEQLEWLLQWSKLGGEDQGDSFERTDCQMQLLAANNQNKNLTQERDQLSEQLKGEMEEHLVLQKAFEKVTYDYQFATSQKEQLRIERDGMILRLEELNSKNHTIVAKLEAQISSMQAIISELTQQIVTKENLRLQLLKDLDSQERVHLQEKQSLLENNNLDITCSICLDVWNEIGPHRVVSLPCGHLFGDSCIRSYLMRCTICPLCRQVAIVQDLRYIVGKRIFPNQ